MKKRTMWVSLIVISLVVFFIAGNTYFHSNKVDAEKEDVEKEKNKITLTEGIYYNFTAETLMQEKMDMNNRAMEQRIKERKKAAKAEKEKEITEVSMTGNYMTTNALNMRGGPGLDFDVIGSLTGYEKAVASKKAETDGVTWYKVTANGMEGWVSASYLEEYKEQTKTSSSTSKSTSDKNSKEENSSTKESKSSEQTKQEDNSSNVVQLSVPYINQYAADAPMGCEASALLQALHFKGNATNHSLGTFLKKMPVSEEGNPNNGFGGTPYEVVKGTYQSIYPAPLASWGAQHGSVSNISGSSSTQLKQELDNGNPVIVFVTLDFNEPIYNDYFWGTGIDNAHVVTLSGYKDGAYHITDPARGQYWVNSSNFESKYNLTKRAVAVR